MRWIASAFALFALGLATTLPAAYAANTPCSGRKGGIAHCQGDTFICNDGSISASKKLRIPMIVTTDSGDRDHPSPDGHFSPIPVS